MAQLKSGYIPSLDGLRTVSIGIVFAAHAGLGRVVPGGFGVTIFFFISGFLITTLLCREQDRYGSISFRAFYLRRLLRLTPPLVLALALGIGLVWLGYLPHVLDPMTLISQFFFFFNYYTVYGTPYAIPGTGVLWSLSVEEHFYLIWPALFVLFAAGRLKTGWIWVFLALFPLWRAVRHYGFGMSSETIYYLSDTRLDSLLFGCALALMIWRGQIPALVERPAVRNGTLLLALAGILVSFLWRSEDFRAVARYSLQGLALTPIFFYALTRPDLAIFRPLNWGWMRWLGVWSYSIYLVHQMMIVAFSSDRLPPLVSAALAAGAAILWAALLYRFVELPFARLRAHLTGHMTPAPRTAP